MGMTLMGKEELILEAIANGNTKPDYVTLAYALLIPYNEEADFERINKAIVVRWGLTTLDYIKKKARETIKGRY